DPAARGRDRLRPGRAEPVRAAVAQRSRPVQRHLADAGHPPARGGRVRLVLRLRPLGLAIPLGRGLRAAARTAARKLTGSYPQETPVDNSAGIGPVRTVPLASRCTLLWISLWITQGVGLAHSHNLSYRRSGGSPSGSAVRYSRGHWQSTN